MNGFKICGGTPEGRGKGFHIGLSNGFTVSVQFGRGNYCEHHHDSDWQGPEKGRSFNAETAVLAPKTDDIVPVNGEIVQGWQSPDDVVRLLVVVARQKPTATRIRIRQPKEDA